MSVKLGREANQRGRGSKPPLGDYFDSETISIYQSWLGCDALSFRAS